MSRQQAPGPGLTGGQRPGEHVVKEAAGVWALDRVVCFSKAHV